MKTNMHLIITAKLKLIDIKMTMTKEREGGSKICCCEN